jgi:hypothetical protein
VAGTVAVAVAAALGCVGVKPGFDAGQLVPSVHGRSVVGLVVPDAGPTTSEARARASLVRGEIVNSLRGELPTGPRLVRICPSARRQIGIPAGSEQPNDRRYVAVYALPGSVTGILVSHSTRIPGLISIADPALGVQFVEHREPVAYLRSLDARIDANNRWRKPALFALLGAIAVAAVAAPPAAVAAFPIALLGNLGLGIAGLAGAWALALVAAPFGRTRLALLSVGAIALYAAAMAIDDTWVALSPLGPSQNSRFYGLSNVLATLLLPPALVGATLARGRLGWTGFGAVAGLALLTVAAGGLGADGGGAVVLLVAFGALAMLLARRVAPALALGAALFTVAILAVVAGPSTHVTDAIADPLSAFVERAELAWLRVTVDAATFVVAVASIAMLALLVVRGPRRPLSLALAAAIAASLVVNDSPLEVAVVGLAGYVALARWESASPRALR